MPFAGAYVVQHYGRPSRRQHAVQVEIDRSLYMDERLVEPSPGFEEFRCLLSGIVAELTAIGRPDGLRVAAE
jgi:N-formylglutamate amidohydrolase